ncbi:hypothetical protein ACFQX6_55050 [Streptosporangium lutulentum]
MGFATIRDQGTAALNRVVDRVIGETARRKLPDDVQQTLRVVYRVLAGRAEPSEIAAVVAPRPVRAVPTREELRRRMEVLMQRPAPPGTGSVTRAVAATVPGAVVERPGADKPVVAEEAPSGTTSTLPEGAVVAPAEAAVATMTDAVGTTSTLPEGIIAAPAGPAPPHRSTTWRSSPRRWRTRWSRNCGANWKRRWVSPRRPGPPAVTPAGCSARSGPSARTFPACVTSSPNGVATGGPRTRTTG